MGGEHLLGYDDDDDDPVETVVRVSPVNRADLHQHRSGRSICRWCYGYKQLTLWNGTDTSCARELCG